MPAVGGVVVAGGQAAGEGVYDDGAALLRGLEIVVVAAPVVGEDDVWRWYVVVERGAGELFGDARCCAPFRRGVVGHDDLDGPRIVGREVEVR